MELRNQTTLNEPCPWNLKHLLWTASLWKSLMKLTLPSETHTSWFCCCWMVSFNAPYQPSFMLFMLMVARGQSQEGRHQITQDNPAESGFFATNKRYIVLIYQPHCTSVSAAHSMQHHSFMCSLIHRNMDHCWILSLYNRVIFLPCNIYIYERPLFKGINKWAML